LIHPRAIITFPTNGLIDNPPVLFGPLLRLLILLVVRQLPPWSELACGSMARSLMRVTPGSPLARPTPCGACWRPSLEANRRAAHVRVAPVNLTITSEMENAAASLEAKGKTAIFCATESMGIMGVIAIADTIRPEARAVIRHLTQVAKVDVWMITGDNIRTACAVAQELGIPNDRIMAEVLPKDKADKVASLQLPLAPTQADASWRRRRQPSPPKKAERSANFVAFVGDGINDAPALTRADIGLAIGAGTEIAIEAADMVLMRSDLCDVVTALDLAKRTFNRIRWNFFWAFLYNTLGIPIAAGVLYPAIRPGTLPPAAAGLAMALSSVSVVLSSLALKLYKKPTIAIDISKEFDQTQSFTGLLGSDWDRHATHLVPLKRS